MPEKVKKKLEKQIKYSQCTGLVPKLIAGLDKQLCFANIFFSENLKKFYNVDMLNLYLLL